MIDVDMTALRTYHQCRCHAVTRKNRCSIDVYQVYNNVDMSVQFMRYTRCEVRISRDNGCSAGRIGERDDNTIMG